MRQLIIPDKIMSSQHVYTKTAPPSHEGKNYSLQKTSYHRFPYGAIFKLPFCKTPIMAMLFPCQHNPALVLIESYAIPEHLFYILLIKSIPIPPIFYLP